MIKQVAWNTFKNTGDINTMMEIIKTDETLKEKQNKTTEEWTINGGNKNQRNSIGNSRYER